MRRNCRFGIFVGIVVLATALSAAVGQAQRPSRTRNILVKPENQLSGVELALSLSVSSRRAGAYETIRAGEALVVGDAVVICFSSTVNGYVTVWSHDAEGNVPVRIYPNEFAAETADEVAAEVDAGVETCIGDDDGFRLEVSRPLGEASIYMHYTENENLQFDESDFPEIRASRGPDSPLYASTTAAYRVVE